MAYLFTMKFPIPDVRFPIKEVYTIGDRLMFTTHTTFNSEWDSFKDLEDISKGFSTWK